MPWTILIAIVLLILLAAWLYSRFYRQHLIGEKAPERQVKVTILDKQAIDIADVHPGEPEQEYWIYVQKGKLGPKREFMVGMHYYHALTPGDQGILTYRGQKFIHFAMQRAN